jgi:hypothetical protein
LADSKIVNAIRIEMANLFVHIGLLFNDYKCQLLGTLDNVSPEAISKLHPIQLNFADIFSFFHG